MHKQIFTFYAFCYNKSKDFFTITKEKVKPWPEIEDSKKLFYYRGLSNWDTEKGYLIDTCLDGQDAVIALLRALQIDIPS